MKTHTSKSLGKYLGQDMKTPNGRGYLGCIKLNDIVHIFGESYSPRSYKASTVYPILKTYDKLIEPMDWEGKEIIPMQYIYGLSNGKIERSETPGYSYDEMTICERAYNGIKVTPKSFYIGVDFRMNNAYVTIFQYEKLLAFGFGAIPCSESPTGYIDLFSHVCEVER